MRRQNFILKVFEMYEVAARYIAGLLNPVVNELASRMKRIALWLTVNHHRLIAGICRILAVYHTAILALIL